MGRTSGVRSRETADAARTDPRPDAGRGGAARGNPRRCRQPRRSRAHHPAARHHLGVAGGLGRGQQQGRVQSVLSTARSRGGLLWRGIVPRRRLSRHGYHRAVSPASLRGAGAQRTRPAHGRSGHQHTCRAQPDAAARPRSPSWTLVYRDLCEWATLYDLICYQRFTTDTLIVRDGLLRSKIFAGDLFIQMYRRMVDAIDRIYRDRRREVFLVGLAKHSQVLRQYAVAMAVANTFPTGNPCYVAVPRGLQQKVYVWEEYIRSPDDGEAGEAPKFNIGEMHFVRFGGRSGDPVWTADLLA